MFAGDPTAAISTIRISLRLHNLVGNERLTYSLWNIKKLFTFYEFQYYPIK
jgi:hypothetical protein